MIFIPKHFLSILGDLEWSEYEVQNFMYLNNDDINIQNVPIDNEMSSEDEEEGFRVVERTSKKYKS